MVKIRGLKKYCKKCGVLQDNCFLVQLTPKREICLCTTCFEWARDKNIKQIKEACNKNG